MTRTGVSQCLLSRRCAFTSPALPNHCCAAHLHGLFLIPKWSAPRVFHLALGVWRSCFSKLIISVILNILYFRLKPLDIEFMKRLHEKVNIIPLIAKADTLTPEECQQFKKQVGWMSLNSWVSHTIHVICSFLIFSIMCYSVLLLLLFWMVVYTVLQITFENNPLP